MEEVIPKDVLRQCFVRMPYTSIDKLKAVCKSWEAILSSPTFYADRKKCGTSKQLICLIQKDRNHRYMHPLFVVTVYDPVEGTWERLPPIDDPHNTRIPIWCQCVAVNRKLLLIGGMHPSRATLMNNVYIYDFESTRWRRGVDMPTPRSFFACSVSSSTGLVYVAGGFGERDTPLAAVEAYDVEKDKWEILPPMIESHGQGCSGVFIDGKFMVLDEGQSGEVFDPSEGRWRMTAHWGNFRGGLRRSCVVSSSSSGEVYVFTEQGVEKYDVEKDVWTVVASFPNPRDILFITCATQWRDQIFVSGLDALRKHISYLFNPSTREFTKVNSDGGKVFAGITISAATVEI